LFNEEVMRMNTFRLLCPLASIVALAACTTTPRSPAPVVDRGTLSRSAEPSRGAATAPQRVADPRGYYTVRKGDTLVHIAQDFGQNYRDLVVWNNLANANDIKVDQLLRVSPPEPGSGAPQAASVSVGSGVEVRPLGTAPGVAISAPVATAPAATSATSTGVVANKSGPRGEKRPYSDAALADMQKPESASYSAAAPAATAPAGTARSSENRNAVPPSAALVPAPAGQSPSSPAPSAPLADDDNISWVWPTDGKVVSGFNDGRKGLDIAGKSGQQIVAASTGKVIYAGFMHGYGNIVIVKHTSNLLSAYAHNKTILVKESQMVSKGQKIAEMGNSDSDVVKLHFEIRQQSKPVDPSKFLPAR
jgi:lipoprotein NlpD